MLTLINSRLKQAYMLVDGDGGRGCVSQTYSHSFISEAQGICGSDGQPKLIYFFPVLIYSSPAPNSKEFC